MSRDLYKDSGGVDTSRVKPMSVFEIAFSSDEVKRLSWEVHAMEVYNVLCERATGCIEVGFQADISGV